MDFGDSAKAMKRIQLCNASELSKLDPVEVIEGYGDGFRGEPEPGDNRSYAYWHGWTKGALDGGHRQKTASDASLAHDFVRISESMRNA